MKLPNFFAVLFGASATVAAPLDHAAQKKQLENLLNAAQPFAEIMLKQHGEFFPFGSTMSPAEKITSVNGDTGDEHPKSVEVIALLKKAFSRLLKNSAEPPLRPENAIRKAARKGVSSERLSPSELTPRKRFLAQPEGQHRFGSGAALELPGKAVEALHRQLKPCSRPKSCVASASIVFQQPVRRDATSGKILACALVCDVRTIPPDQTEKIDAIAIDLDHRDGRSVTMFYPYHLDSDRSVTFGQFFATKGSDDIFPREKNN